jgi:acetyl esterase/lipase
LNGYLFASFLGSLSCFYFLFLLLFFATIPHWAFTMTILTTRLRVFARVIPCFFATLIPAPFAAVTTFLCASFFAWAQTPFRGLVPPITSGFGAAGAITEIDTLRFPAIGWDSAGIQRNVEIYTPRGERSPRPTLLFAHGFGGNDPRFYGEIFRNVVSRGYTAVFVPYPISLNFPALYRTLDSGFAEAVRRFPSAIDSTRIGFAGHSFGAGAIPSIAYKAYTERGWGANGKFLFPMAPWYALDISQEQLRSFPLDVKMIMQIYADDAVNDHALAMDIFLNINIPDTEKDFITVFADTVQNYVYSAGHNLCTMETPTGGVFDAYDYYAVFRLLDALMRYAFDPTDNAAKNVALGDGSPEQVFMGEFAGRALKPLTSTNRPTPLTGAPRTTFQCNNIANPRRNFCTLPAITGVERRGEQNIAGANATGARLYPQPAADRARVAFVLPAARRVSCAIFDALGRRRSEAGEGKEWEKEDVLPAGAHEWDLPLERLPNGFYICRLLLGDEAIALPFSVQR